MKFCQTKQCEPGKAAAHRQTELALVSEASRRLVRWRTLYVCCHAPLLGRCVDLAYISGNMLLTVEFKLRDWRRGLIQARDHRLATDYAYICMPERNVSQQMLDELDKTGVGLLFFREKGDWPFETIKGAPKSTEVWRAARSELWDYIVANKRS